ncbi:MULTISPECIES: hypothetical protein [Paenibacillus]|uniref:hypothetical protein n=1 Tax=Paenibacillus TaxID=44249 RepID=UPI00117C9378|nr:hypothetical protein [Paenibacillus odorifer]
MIGSSLIILYGMVSVLGAVGILIKGSAKSAVGYIYLFLLSHITLVVITLYALCNRLTSFGLLSVFSTVLSPAGSTVSLSSVRITGFITLLLCWSLLWATS